MKIVKYFLVLLVPALFIASGSLSYLYISNAPSDDPVHATVDTEIPTYINEQELWTLIGNYKQENGLQIPIKDEGLCTVARMRLGQISEDWSHDGFRQDWKWSITANRFTQMAENLAKEQTDAYSVLNGWKNSKTHNDVLMLNRLYACVECANINGTNYCVYLSAI